MVRSNRGKIVCILVFFLSTLAFVQNKQAKEDKQLREEILAAYKSGGEQVLLDFVKKRKHKISNKFVVDFAESGVKERKEEWLNISNILAEGKKNEKILADVLYKTGKYFTLLSDNKKSFEYLDKALPIYLKINDAVGQGNVCLAKGINYYSIGDNSRALTMAEKAMSFFENAEDTQGQGNVYMLKGNIYFNTGDNSSALEIYEKALAFFEKSKDPQGLGSVYLSNGNIYLRIGKNSRALEMYEKALAFFEKSKDAQAQGIIYERKGDIYSRIGENLKAHEMYDIALLFFEKTRSYIDQGNIYESKGGIYFYTGDNLKALEMYDKALPFFEKMGAPIGQGNVYRGKGDIYFHTGDSSRALAMYDKALPFFEKAGNLIGQGNVYRGKGNIHFYTGDNSRALAMYDKALTFFEKAGDILDQGNVYRGKGETYFYTGDNSKAIEMYNKALTFFEKAGAPLGQGNVYMSKGSIYFCTGDNSKALEMYEKALPFFEKAGEPRGQGNIYMSKGDIYLRIGDNSRALAMYDNALSFFQEAGALLGQGNIYEGKGDIYLRIGDNLRAFELYDKALSFFEKGGDILGQGNVYSSKGDIYLIIGDNLKALEMYNKALPFFEKTGEPLGQGNVYQSKGDIYFNTGNNSKAVEMYDKALPFFKKAEEPLGQGNVYRSKGDIYFNTGNNSKAVEMYDKALPFFKKTGDPIGRGYVYLSKGDIHFDNGDNLKAVEMYDKALHFFEKAESPLGQGNVYQSKGDMYLYIGDNSIALDMYDKAITFYDKEGAIEPKSNVLHGKAKVFVNLKKKAKAMVLFEKAISKLEKVRTQTTFSEMKRTFMKTVYDQYEDTALFMLENKYYEKGFKYAETMRARVFLDQMVEGFVRLDKGQPTELKDDRDKMVAKLSLLSKEIHQTAGKENEKKLQELKEQYHKVENNFEELLLKIRLSNPMYASVRYPQPISVQTLQKEVLKTEEILVRYFISLEKLYVFLVSKDYFKVLPINIQEMEISNIVERYLLATAENNPRSIKKYGKAFYEKLFKPLETTIKKNQDIIIIPDGELAKVPFESFIIDQTKSGRPVFLLEKYHVKYIQSASILSILRKHYTREGAAKSFIGFGDPVYDYKNFKQGKSGQGTFIPSGNETDEIKEVHQSRYARAGGVLPRLQKSGEEVKAIANLFAKQSQKRAVYDREKATEENAKAADMKDFDFIHFACHGLLAEDFQSLVLSQDIPGSKDDGYFTLNEVMNCNYNAKLVVLSACQTGSGKMYKGEGVTGLTRAVMYAGTPAVLASLWKVDDTATKELMVNFYKNMLGKSLDKTEALRQAKLELLKNKKYASPLFWSAFVMYGE